MLTIQIKMAKGMLPDFEQLPLTNETGFYICFSVLTVSCAIVSDNVPGFIFNQELTGRYEGDMDKKSLLFSVSS